MDHQKLAAAKPGDPAALEELLKEVQPKVFRFGMRMCRNEVDAEDDTDDSPEPIEQSTTTPADPEPEPAEDIDPDDPTSQSNDREEDESEGNAKPSSEVQ